MNAFRALATRSTVVVGLGLIALIAAERPLQARQAEPLLQPTPLVLKDGRIASVSIHTVPFVPGRADLSGEAAARVAELTRAVGTDCFLTAQVIGHIDSGEVSQDDTLNAHRLARSRADAVQASLIGGGLPAKAIASVWDWQFMVRAPRATLWIFQLTAGEDCEGRPLQGALVAQATPSSAQSTGQPERAMAPSSERAATTARAAAPTDATPRPAAPAPSARTKAEPAVRAEPPAATPAPTAQAERSAPAKPAERPEAGTAVAARPALAPKAQSSDDKVEQPASQRATAAAKPTTTAAVPAPAGTVEQPASQRATVPASKAATAAAVPAPPGAVEPPVEPRETATVVAAKPASAASAPASDGKVESGDGRLVITFATNSSYFPAGATRRLRQLIAGLESGSQYEVSVQVAVSGSTKVVGARSPQEAATYNKWLAERRLERVENWLREHAAAALNFKPEYVTDESRQVVVQLAPTG